MTRRWKTLASALLLAVALGTAIPSIAQEPPAPAAAGPSVPAAPVPWSSLSPNQQQLLSRFGGQWSSLPPARQQALAHGSERWLAMSPAQRDAARDRFAHWQSLPPEQRQALRSRWQRFQALSPEQRATVRDNFHRFQQLPPERRQMLREQWRNASPAQRQQMIQHAREQRQRRMSGGRPAPSRQPHR
jgi:Protein of unknown function (DUF3106)